MLALWFVLLAGLFAVPAMAQIEAPTTAGQLLEQVRPPMPFPDVPDVEEPETEIKPPAKDEPRVRQLSTKMSRQVMLHAIVPLPALVSGSAKPRLAISSSA